MVALLRGCLQQFLHRVCTVAFTMVDQEGLYENLARNTLILGFSTAIIQILIGSLGLDAIGFVWANLLGTFFMTFLLLKVIIRESALRHEYKLALVWTVLVKHKKSCNFHYASGLVNTAFLFSGLFH